MLNKDRLTTYRAETFNTLPGKRLASREEAVEFVNQRGFIYFWPIKGVTLPSLWVATAGDRPVPKEHDDPGNITWDWKDSLLGKHRWYYARLLRRRNTIVSLSMAPYFYALSPNYGDPETDYLEEYQRGVMSLETKLIYEALLNIGPLDTLQLRREAHLTSRDSDTRFNRALDDLQISMRILPVGISDSGAWHYSFIYDLVPRHLPDLLPQAGAISEPQARSQLVSCYLRSVGAIARSDLQKLFGWPPELLARTLLALESAQVLCTGGEMDGEKGEWIYLPELKD